MTKNYRLTDSQKGIYFECAENPESTRYNIPFSMPIPAGTDKERLARAAEAVAAMHPAFRITFAMDADSGEPVMRLTDTPVRVRRSRSTGKAEAERLFVRPFDLENGPLVRLEVCSTKEGDLFLLDAHHLIFDGGSLSLFLHQTALAYEGKEIEPEAFTLFDRSAYELTGAAEEVSERCMKFFREMFDGTDCDSQLIPDLDPSFQPAGTAVPLEFELPASLGIEGVESFTAGHGITESTFFTAAFAYVLGTFCGIHESTFTIAGSGRHGQNLSSTVGMFVRTLPLHIPFSCQQDTAEYLSEVQRRVHGAARNSSASFTRISHEMGINMSASFVYQGSLLSEVGIGGTAVLPRMLPLSDCPGDMLFMVMKCADCYRAQVYYDTRKYSQGLIRSFSQAVFAAAEQLLTAETVGEISLDSPSVSDAWRWFNDTASDGQVPQTVLPVIEGVFATQPEAAAVVCKDTTVTFSELDRLSSAIASYIHNLCLGAEDFVGIMVPRNEYMVIAAWGVIRSGAAFQPLDPSYPAERLEYMLADSGAKLLIADRSLRQIVSGYTGNVLYTDEIESLPATPGGLASPRPQDAITMIYTSGTTGKPKGSVLEQRNLAAFWRNHSETMNFTPASRVASYASFGFDAGVMDVLTVPMSGAALYIIPDEIRLDLPAIEQFFCRNGITHGFMTTQLGRMFAQQTQCSTLQAFLVGGEKLVPFEPKGTFRFLNGYGPCETMGYICSHTVTDGSNIQPIGAPSRDTRLYVVDQSCRLLPEGAAGELCISGCQVGRGYLGLPEKTAAAFVPNSIEKGLPGYERMYRTGDVVRLLPSGELEFIGRRDGQVKIRGFRVELTEIEEVIRRFDGITDATLAACDDPAGGKYIAAYIVGPAPIDTAALAEFIRSEKPAYMVPAVMMQIDAIPYTQNQKVNRRALPQPQRTAASSGKTAPENEAQRRIFDIAAEILGHKDFGVTTDIFEAGLTSIGLLKFNAALSNAFGCTVRINDLRRLATIRAIEGFLSQAGATKVWDRQEDYPLMQNQMGVFVECGMNEGSLDYNIPLLMKVSGTLDPEALRTAVSAAIDAHPYLKTTLRSDEEGRIRAVRNDGMEPAVEIVRTEALPGALELITPFKLLGEPLYRARIYLTDEGNYLLLDVHHIISDGTSLGILLADIDTALAGGTLTAESYTGYEAALEEEALRTAERLDAAKTWYDGQLKGADTGCLPGKCPEKGAAEGSSAQKSFPMDGCSEAVQEFCKARGITLNAFFNAVFGYVLTEFIHSESATWCTVYNGRGDSRLASSFAMLVKTLPVCCCPALEASPEEFVRSMQEQLVSTMSHDAMSFAEISSAYGLKSDIFFNYQGDSFNFDSLGGKPADMITLDVGASKAPLVFEVFLENGSFRIDAAWREDLYCREFIDSFVSALQAAAAGFTSAAKLGQVELMTESQMLLFDRMNATDAHWENVPVQTLFERQAALFPDRIAVRTATAPLTFAMLDEMSSRLANSLLEMGAGDNEVIGMILERSEYVPVAEIGVLKAGCAFLPILPSYPQERRDFCLKDAGVRFCITEDNVRDLVRNGAPERPETVSKGTDLAYCIYTSGSTGTPKGVMIEQHNLSNLIQTGGLNETYDRGSSTLCISSISFDMSIAEIIWPLCHGRSIYVASEDEIHNLDKLLLAFETSQADMMTMTPSLLWSLLSMKEFEKPLSHLKAVVLGAEAFQPMLLPRLRALNPDMFVQNGYGPTECTVSCSAKAVEPDSTITIGGPFANMKFYVMNNRRQLLPTYAVGELIICGEGVSRGYVGLPEKNKASFLELRGLRAYCSGDLVRVNRDGEVEFGGRKDNQVKLRGFRVELDEIEAVMDEYEGVTRSKVVVRGSGADAFLAGFFTADRAVDIDSLTSFIKTKLTHYMVPAAMMQLDRMPLTVGGKLDARALPEIKPAVRTRSAKRAPKKSLEQLVIDEFQAATGAKEVFLDDNFFEIGGTSLSASKAVMKLKSAGYKIEYQDIFDNQTAEELAACLASRGAAAAASASSAGGPEESGEDADIHEEAFTRRVLAYNTLEFAPKVTRKDLGDVLLTGATGFLGCHILRELLRSQTGHVTCLLRRSHYKDAFERLRAMMFYYFDAECNEAMDSRVTVIEGDITDKALDSLLADAPFDTAINCAACVKHYANDDSITAVNVGGVRNLISICSGRDARLIQISTTSIPGAHTSGTYLRHLTMSEDRLFYVDDMNNQYCQSKYQAELLMFQAIADGMKGKVIRVGNLMGRHSDGEFQINTHTNAFLNALRGFVTIGKCPISHCTDRMGLSPIDCTARAVVLLAGTDDCFTAFNADSRWPFDEMKIMESVNRCGLKVVPVQDEEYYADFYRMMGDEKTNEKVSALLTNDRPDIHLVDTDNRFTTNVLYRLGFSWPFVDDDYIDRIIRALDTLGFFTL